MNKRLIPAVIMLIAGAVVSFINIINKVDVTKGLVRLLLIMVGFYLIGLIVRFIIVKVTSNNVTQTEEEEDEGENTEEPEKDDAI